MAPSNNEKIAILSPLLHCTMTSLREKRNHRCQESSALFFRSNHLLFLDIAFPHSVAITLDILYKNKEKRDRDNLISRQSRRGQQARTALFISNCYERNEHTVLQRYSVYCTSAIIPSYPRILTVLYSGRLNSQ